MRSGTGDNASGYFKPGLSKISWTVTDIHGITNTWQTDVKVERVSASIPDVTIAPQGGNVNTFYLGYMLNNSVAAEASGGTAPYFYSWNTGDQSNSITVDYAPTVHHYEVTVTDALGCVDKAQKDITVTDIRCGEDKNKVSVCNIWNNIPSTDCVDSSAVASLLANGSFLGICTSNIDNISRAGIANIHKLQVSVFPNPTASVFNIRFHSPDNKIISFRVLNSYGSLVEERKNLISGAVLEIGRNYPAGVYFMEVVQDQDRQIYKLIKQN
jgi:hypothetical protein